MLNLYLGIMTLNSGERKPFPMVRAHENTGPEGENPEQLERAQNAKE